MLIIWRRWRNSPRSGGAWQLRFAAMALAFGGLAAAAGWYGDVSVAAVAAIACAATLALVLFASRLASQPEREEKES